MKTAIFPTLNHCMSSDAKPQHGKCPEGKDSWCFFQRALANNQRPKSHKYMKTSLSEIVVEKILPVYQRLASDEILSRCISAKTQNSNESLHSCIWRKCPKEVFISKNRLELGITAAIKEYNLGHVATLSVDERSVHDRNVSAVIASRKDHRRSSQRKRKSSEAYKKDRNQKKYSKKALVESEKKVEGVTYAAGSF